MTVVELLMQLHKLDIRIWAEGDRLRYLAPKNSLTPALRTELLAHKADLLNLLLQAQQPADTGAELRPLPREQTLPLSFAQQRLWFLDQMAPGNPFYNVPVVLPLQHIDVAVLERTLNEIVQRHETFRTTFGQTGGQPYQRIAAEYHLALPVVDLGRLPEDKRASEALRLAKEEADQPFDLERGPLVRARLLRFDAVESQLLLTMHHIISDGWSMDIFFDEVRTLYKAFRRGQPSPLPALPIQYADFALWQRNWLHGERLNSQLTYWKTRLADLPVLQMPTVYPRPPLPSYAGANHEVRVPPDLAQHLERLGRQEGATLFMTLLSAFVILLQRYSGQDDIVIGIPVAGRNRAELEGLIGFFVNTLILRIDVSGDPTFRELLARVREEAIAAYAHEDLPFEKLVEELHAERDPSRNPLAQITFQLWHAGADPSTEGQLAPQVERGVAIFDLAFRLWDTPNGIGGGIEYSTDLFDAAYIARLTGHWRAILRDVVANPDARVSQVQLLPPDEQRRLLERWRGATVDFGPPQLLHRLFELQAAGSADRPAVRFGERSLTFGQLDRRANQLAHRLLALGVGPGSIVAVSMTRSLELPAALLGILKAGAAYLPLDPTYPDERLRYMLEHAEAAVLLTDSGSPPPWLSNEVTLVTLDEAWSAVGAEPDCPVAVNVSPANLAYVIYTSGSTGKPKGVMISHAAICNHMRWMQAELPLDVTDRVLQKTPFSFDASVWEFFAPLLAGACLVMAAPGAHVDAAALVEEIARYEITVVQFVPLMLRWLLETQYEQLRRCVSLRRVFCGGEELPHDLQQRFLACRDAELYNLYGPTEATIDTTFWRCLPDAAPPIPIGRPIANTRIYILDAHRNLVPPYVPGELYIGGAGVARGYLNNPDLTAARFVADPFSATPGELLYKSGDLARARADGVIDYLGRIDQQVKLRGYRIELGEIGSVLRQHPAVRDAAVAVEGDRLVAFVETEPLEPDEAHEREHLRSWQEVYEAAIYRDIPAAVQPLLNTVGWNSSFSGAPLPAAEMREWLDQTVAQISRHNPQRILDIGCGTGMLLFSLAPAGEVYVGADFSAEVLCHVREQLAPTLAPKVTLLQRRADEFMGLEPRYFDTVILNSVVQYFPGAAYLLRVLEGAVAATAPGGIVFVGDVRSKSLLQAFYTALELYRAALDQHIDALHKVIQERAEQEEELAIDPQFFALLPRQLTRISHVQIAPKRGHYQNELNQFRYDVTLYVEHSFVPVASAATLDWQRDQLDLESLERILNSHTDEQLLLTTVPDSRVFAALQAERLLVELAPTQTAAELRAALAALAPAGVDPASLDDLATAHAYTASFRLSAPGAFDVQFTRCSCPASDLFSAPPRDPEPWRNYTTDPLRALFQRHIVPELRHLAQQQLPDYMVPAAFVLLDSLPLTANGKLDRARLQPNVVSHHARQNSIVAPRTQVEKTLAAIWSEVLGVASVSVEDDFFALGGHSLLAVQIVSRVRTSFGIELPLRQVFAAPRLDELALVIEAILIDEIASIHQ